MSGSGGSGHDGAGQVDHARPWAHGCGHQFPAWQCVGWAGCGYRVNSYMADECRTCGKPWIETWVPQRQLLGSGVPTCPSRAWSAALCSSVCNGLEAEVAEEERFQPRKRSATWQVLQEGPKFRRKDESFKQQSNTGEPEPSTPSLTEKQPLRRPASTASMLNLQELLGEIQQAMAASMSALQTLASSRTAVEEQIKQLQIQVYEFKDAMAYKLNGLRRLQAQEVRVISSIAAIEQAMHGFNGEVKEEQRPEDEGPQQHGQIQPTQVDKFDEQSTRAGMDTRSHSDGYE